MLKSSVRIREQSLTGIGGQAGSFTSGRVASGLACKVVGIAVAVTDDGQVLVAKNVSIRF